MGAMFASCSDNGKKAETTEAKKVEVKNSSETTIFKNVKDNSFVTWRASHLGGVQARFGKVQLGNTSFFVSEGKLTNANIDINMSSLTVENFPEGSKEKGKLTRHLLSPDFFNVDKYPTSKFELTSIEPMEGEFNSKVTGNLTILDKAKSISFNANVNVSENGVSVKSEDFKIDRTDWGLTYNTEGTAGVPVDYLISNDIGFTIDVSATK